MTKGLLIFSIVIVAIIAIIPTIVLVFNLQKVKDKEIYKSILIGVTATNIISLILLICLWITPIKNNEFYIAKEEVSTVVTLENAGFNKLTMNKYLELIKSNEKSIILVARPTCGYCEKFSPLLKEAAKDMDLTINYVNTDEFTNEDWDSFGKSLDYLSKEDWGTPLTLIVQNSKVVAANNGYVELEEIKKFFKENGLGE